jgi:acid phosphatase family membrane protein YuiD
MDYKQTKKFHYNRLFGAGGMPSSHTASIVCITAMIGKKYGITDPYFAFCGTVSLIVMYDAAGVRRAVGKQAKLLNEILSDKKLSNEKKLQEMMGHTPFQVIMGFVFGLIVGILA